MLLGKENKLWNSSWCELLPQGYKNDGRLRVGA